MASKSERMYKDSPSVKKDADGKPEVRKGSMNEREAGKEPAESDKTEAGEGGVPVQAEEMHGRHMTEMKDMHKRHEDEHKDMHKRHEKETKKVFGEAKAEEGAKKNTSDNPEGE